MKQATGICMMCIIAIACLLKSADGMTVVVSDSQTSAGGPITSISRGSASLGSPAQQATSLPALGSLDDLRIFVTNQANTPISGALDGSASSLLRGSPSIVSAGIDSLQNAASQVLRVNLGTVQSSGCQLSTGQASALVAAASPDGSQPCTPWFTAGCAAPNADLCANPAHSPIFVSICFFDECFSYGIPSGAFDAIYEAGVMMCPGAFPQLQKGACGTTFASVRVVQIVDNGRKLLRFR